MPASLYLSTCDHSITTTVMFFNRFAVFIKLTQAPDVTRIEKYVLSMYEVYVCVYENKENGWLLRIGCCEACNRRKMDSKMDMSMFTVVKYFMTRMHPGTKLSAELSGCYKIATYQPDTHVT